jgi:hypothetical protein
MIDISKIKELLDEFEQNATTWQKWRAERTDVLKVLRGIIATVRVDAVSSVAISEEDWKKLYLAIATALPFEEIKLQQSAFAQLLNRLLYEQNALESVDTWQVLFQAELLSKDNFEKIAQHANSNSVVNALKQLAKWGRLNATTFDQVLRHPHIKSLDEGLSDLYQVRKSYFNITSYFPRSKAQVSDFFMNSIIFTAVISMAVFAGSLAIFATVAAPVALSILTGAAIWLAFTGVRKLYLSILHPLDRSLNALLRSPAPAELIAAQDQLTFFERNHSTRQILAASEYPLSLLFLLRSFKKSKANQADYQRFLGIAKTTTNMNYLKEYLAKIVGAPLCQGVYYQINQSDITFVIRNMAIVTHPDIFLLLQDDRVSQNRVDLKQIIERVCEQHNLTDDEKIRSITQGWQAAFHRAAEQVNHTQSTHTASVHESASQSAQKLHEAYSDQVKDEVRLAEIEKVIEKFLEKLPPDLNDSRVNKAARAAFDTVRKSHYQDRVSKVSLRQLFAYTWLAVHDDQKFLDVSVKEREAIFVNALYEIQRGNNLDSHNKDDGQSDKTICPAGRFNKLIECLKVMQHPLVDIVFVTRETANLKLCQLVKSELVRYLESTIKAQGIEESKKLIDRVFAGDPIEEAIWSVIKPTVAAAFIAEFHHVFNDSEESINKMIESGIYFELDEKKYRPHFEKILRLESTKASIKVSEKGLFTARPAITTALNEATLNGVPVMCRVNRLVIHDQF